MAILDQRDKAGGREVYRHPVAVRAAHWASVLAMAVLLFSGLQILNAHPAFYWGEVSRFASPVMEIASVTTPEGELRGEVRIGKLAFDTTGVFGASPTADGQLAARAAPSWLTLPGYLDLGAGRRWHFAFAWVLVISGAVYAAHAIATKRFKLLLLPTRDELKSFGQSLLDHLRLRFDHGQPGYNVLQKLAYLAVLWVLIPTMLLTGLAMSPAMHARLPLLGDLFGGRQSARTFHFLAASGLVTFVAVHLAMVVAAGPWRELRSMLTGWYALGHKPGAKSPTPETEDAP